MSGVGLRGLKKKTRANPGARGKEFMLIKSLRCFPGHVGGLVGKAACCARSQVEQTLLMCVCYRAKRSPHRNRAVFIFHLKASPRARALISGSFPVNK